MAAIVFMARTSTPWALLPVGEFGCGSVTTCWRHFSEWAHAAVFERLQALLLDELGQAGRLDWSRASVDSVSLRAVRGDHTGADPVDRAKRGSTLHLAVDGGGLPLSLLVTGANTGDSRVLEALLEDLAGIATSAGGRRCRPGQGPRGQGLRPPALPRLPHPPPDQGPHRPRWIESSMRLGRHRCKAARSIAWLAGCRRRRVRDDCDAERLFALAMLACARLGSNRLPGTVEAHARSP